MQLIPHAATSESVSSQQLAVSDLSEQQYLQVPPLQVDKFSPPDVVTNEDVLIFSEAEKVQPRSNLLRSPLVN